MGSTNNPSIEDLTHRLLVNEFEAGGVMVQQRVSLEALVLAAWRERWTECEWSRQLNSALAQGPDDAERLPGKLWSRGWLYWGTRRSAIGTWRTVERVSAFPFLRFVNPSCSSQPHPISLAGSKLTELGMMDRW